MCQGVNYWQPKCAHIILPRRHHYTHQTMMKTLQAHMALPSSVRPLVARMLRPRPPRSCRWSSETAGSCSGRRASSGQGPIRSPMKRELPGMSEVLGGWDVAAEARHVKGTKPNIWAPVLKLYVSYMLLERGILLVREGCRAQATRSASIHDTTLSFSVTLILNLSQISN